MVATIKYTEIPVIPNPKDHYQIELTLMHGDADKYETITINCNTEKKFLKMMDALKNMPTPTSMGGTTYETWCMDNFGDIIPHDCKYGYEVSATVDSFEGIYWDQLGVKYHAGVVES